jgi:DNA (cytosine-5)-methyltransferase 1
MKVVDLFCGTGALSYGITCGHGDFEVVAGIDMDPVACATARLNHPAASVLCADITTVSPSAFASTAAVGRVDLIVGGPPCQGFSSLRPNRSTNTNDSRNDLYSNFAEYVEYFAPPVFLMENVVGLVTHSDGKLLNSLTERFARIGYVTEWRIVNTANFGIPQKRERFILVGRKVRASRPQISFPSPTHRFVGKVIGTRYKDRCLTNPRRGRDAITVMDAISDLPPVEAGGEVTEYLDRPHNAYQRARRRGVQNTLTLHNATAHSPKMISIAQRAGSSRNDLPAGLVTSGFSSTYSRLAPDEPATTITVKFTSPASSKCIHPFAARAITPREAARLQGFDDAFVFVGGRTQVAEQIGNAVPPLLGSALAPWLAEFV